MLFNLHAEIFRLYLEKLLWTGQRNCRALTENGMGMASSILGYKEMEKEKWLKTLKNG